MKSNVHGLSWKRCGIGAVAITSAEKGHGEDRRGRKESKEDISVCLNCTRAECHGKCRDIDDSRK